MRPRLDSTRRRLIYGALTVALTAASCRVGYDELDANALAGAATIGNGGSSSGGAERSQVGGTVNAPIAGAPDSGGSAPGAAGANADAAGGAVGSAAGCTTTADCTCETFANRSYWFCKNALNWSDAKAHCQTQAMGLTRIDSEAENAFLVATAQADGVFALNGFALIGASDRAVAGEWRWGEGTLFWQGGPTGSVVSGRFAKWAASNPSVNGVRQCAGLLQAADWQVRSCTAVVPFICQQP